MDQVIKLNWSHHKVRNHFDGMGVWDGLTPMGHYEVCTDGPHHWVWKDARYRQWHLNDEGHSFPTRKQAMNAAQDHFDAWIREALTLHTEKEHG